MENKKAWFVKTQDEYTAKELKAYGFELVDDANGTSCETALGRDARWPPCRLVSVSITHARKAREITDSTSDQISRSVVSNSWRPHEARHARPPCPSPTPGVH